MTFNASDRKDIRNAEKSAKLSDANRIAFIRTIMGTLGGREWMHQLLRNCHVFSTPYVSGDPHATAFNCGQQNIGLQTFADVVAQTPTEYALMMQEAQIKEEANDRRNSDDAGTRDWSTNFELTADGFVHDDSGAPADDPTSDDADRTVN